MFGQAGYSASRGSRDASMGYAQPDSRYTSRRVGDILEDDRLQKSRQRRNRVVLRLAIILALVVAMLAGAIFLYASDVLVVENVEVVGADHLTQNDLSVLIDIPEGTTLMRVDVDGIRKSLLRDAWVEDVKVNQVFPHTVQVVIKERTIAAVVEVTSQDARSTQNWAIASDGMWLMVIPDKESEVGQQLNEQIYKDAENVLHITDVPYGTSPEMGTYCTDSNVNNAINIVSGLTTSLSDQVASVSASDAESTKLVLKNGIEIAFGTADNIREKERVCLQIMKQHPDEVVYINVRTVDRPTYRSL